MRILFVSNARVRGGGEEFLRDLLPGLARRGAQVGLVCRPGTPLETMFRDLPVTVYPVERSGIRGAVSIFKIARIMREGNYGVVSIQRGHDIIQTWLSSLWSGTRPRLFLTVHIAGFIKSRFLLGRLDGVIAISRHVYDRLMDFDPGLSDRTTIIHNGIDLNLFDRAKGGKGFIRDRFGLSTETPLISTTGLMWKNQVAFLEALSEIRKRLPGVKYLLLTPLNGIPQIQEFKDRAASFGLTESVLWLNSLPKEDMPSYYADIDLAVSVFPNEGFGLWVVEALAMGTPVIALDGGGVRDALGGCPAALLIKDGPKELAAAAIRILTDRKLKQYMAEAGPAWVAERFSSERMAENYDRYFSSLPSN